MRLNCMDCTSILIKTRKIDFTFENRLNGYTFISYETLGQTRVNSGDWRNSIPFLSSEFSVRFWGLICFMNDVRNSIALPDGQNLKRNP
jgi:hypothetical protein